MVLSILKAVEQIKSEIAAALPGDVIVTLCRQFGASLRDECISRVTAFSVEAFFVRRTTFGIPGSDPDFQSPS